MKHRRKKYKLNTKRLATMGLLAIFTLTGIGTVAGDLVVTASGQGSAAQRAAARSGSQVTIVTPQGARTIGDAEVDQQSTEAGLKRENNELEDSSMASATDQNKSNSNRVTTGNAGGNSSKTDDKNKDKTDDKNKVKEEDKSAVKEDNLILVNKSNPLPAEYVPSDLTLVDLPAVRETQLRKEAADALVNLFAGAGQESMEFKCISGYRSAELQGEIFNEHAVIMGDDGANLVSAKATESEHQTGLAIDVSSASVDYDLVTEYEETTEGQWLAANAHQYGFIVRYLKDKTEITGYSYEPWHLRYVGTEAATKIYEGNLTLEEYLATPQ